MTAITKTVQDRIEPEYWWFPWLFAHEIGQEFIIEYKRAGQVVRVEKFKLVAGDHADTRRWQRVDGESAP